MPTNTVYDPEQEDIAKKPAADGSHDDLDISPEQRDQETGDLENLHNAESAPGKDKKTSADEKESGKLENQVGKGYTSDGEDNKKSSKSGSSRKKGIAGLVSVILVTGSVGMLGILQGPFQLVHASQLLQRFHFLSDEEFMDGRAGQLITHVRYRNQARMRNLGMVGNKIANRYETKLKNAGIELEYGSGRGDRVSKVTFDMKNPKAVQGLREIESRGGTITGMVDGKAVVDVGVDSGRTGSRRGVVKGVVKGLGLSRVSSSVGSRTMTRRAGVDLHPLKNIAKFLDEKVFEYVKRVRENRNNRRANGVTAPDVSDSDTKTDTDDPEKIRDEAMDNGRTDTPDGTIDIEGKLKKILGDTGKALMVVAVICAIQGMNDSIEETMQTLVVLPLIRTGTEIVAMGNQVMDGKDVNFDELGATATQFYDQMEEPGAKSFFSAKSIQSELGENPTGPDMPDAAKPSGEKPKFFQMVDKFIEALPVPGGLATAAIDNVCKVATNSWVGGAVDAITGVLSGGLFTAILQVGSGVGQDKLVSYFADDLARWFVSKPIALNASGALLGNYANYGTFLAGNENAIAHGGAALSKAQVAALKAEQNEILLAKIKQKSPFDRYLNLYDVDSLASRSIIQNPDLSSPPATIASIFAAPFSVFSDFSNMFSKTIAPGVFAQVSEPYDYGVTKYGFSKEDADDPMFDDPYENAEWVEPKLQDLNDKYSKCFGTKIDPTTFKIQDTTNGKGVKYHDLKANEDDCGFGEKQNTTEEFRRYRMYLADQYTAKSLACYEGLDEEACVEIGFTVDGGGQQTGGSGGTGEPNTGGKIVGDPYTDTTGVACAEGTRDIGIQDGYTNGVMFKVRLCSLTNLPSNGQADNPGGQFSTNGADGHAIVNSKVSGAWYGLIEAAKADGINFSVISSFRSAGHQQSLWNANPNSEEVARPGYSSHQAGVALDFNNMSGKKNGATCSSRATNSGAGYKWLVANAATYGFKQYAVEAWHWDALNAASRC